MCLNAAFIWIAVTRQSTSIQLKRVRTHPNKTKNDDTEIQEKFSPAFYFVWAKPKAKQKLGDVNTSFIIIVCEYVCVCACVVFHTYTLHIYEQIRHCHPRVLKVEKNNIYCTYTNNAHEFLIEYFNISDSFWRIRASKMGIKKQRCSISRRYEHTNAQPQHIRGTHIECHRLNPK